MDSPSDSLNNTPHEVSISISQSQTSVNKIDGTTYKNEETIPPSDDPRPESIDGSHPLEQQFPEKRHSSDLDLKDQGPPAPGITSQAPLKHSPKLRQLLIVTIALSLTVPLAIFTFYYLYEALVSENPHLGRLFLSPSRTLNLVSVLTNSLATLLPIIIKQLFDTIRWQLIWRDNGVQALEFLALSAATSLEGLLILGFMRGTHFLWTWQRILLPVLGLFLGIVAQVNITATHIFTVHKTVVVFAGLAPLNASLLNHGLVPVAVLGTYYSAWVSSIIDVPKFVVPINPVRCGGESCTAIFLPGGVEQIRLWKKTLNDTLLNSGTFEDSDVIIAHDAAGYHLEFSPPDEHYSFNQSNDCSLYGKPDQGIYICVGSSGDALVSGWTICPSTLRYTNSCFADQTWTYPSQQNTSLLSFKRFATTAYDRRNLSIISLSTITPVTNASLTRYQPSDFRYIFQTLLTSNTTANNSAAPSDDEIMVSATLFELGWVLRLYSELFTDDAASPQNLLRNMLIIPIHYSVQAWELANSTIQEEVQSAAGAGTNSPDFSLPPELVTTASSASMRPRLRAADWTVYAFIGVAGVLLLYALALFAWIVVGKARALPNTTGFPEIDIVAKEVVVEDPGDADEEKGLAGMLRQGGLHEGGSRDVAREVRGVRLYMGKKSEGKD